MRGSEVLFGVRSGRLSGRMRGAVGGMRRGRREEGEGLTLPSEASMILTGHSRTEARKQNEAGSWGVAEGYQRKSRMGAGCGKVSDVLNNWKDLLSDWARKTDPSGDHLALLAKF